MKPELHKLKYCKVCGQKFSTCRKICLACETFYKRNRDRGLGLPCDSGTNNCDNDSAAVSVWNGSTWRFMCKYCRFKRCRRYLQEMEDAQPGGNVVSKEFIAMEQNFQIVLSGYENVHQQFDALPLINGQGPDDDNEFKKAVAKHMDATTLIIVNFFKSSPQLKSLSLQERMTIFTASFLGICMAECFHGKDQQRFMGMNTYNALRFLTLFPEARVNMPDKNFLAALFKQWNPSRSEFGLFLNLLFFFDSAERGFQSSLEDPIKLDNIRNHIYGLVHGVLMKQFGGDLAKCRERLELMKKAAQVIVGYTSERKTFFSTSFACKNPDMKKSSVMLNSITPH